VLVAWAEASEALERTTTAPRPSETPLEFASRAGTRIGTDRDQLHQFALDTTTAAYGADSLDPAAVTRSRSTAATIERSVHERSSWVDRLRCAADPRPLWRPRDEPPPD
jgi:hypothetical protein